jgi:hypothetical protein
MKECPGTDALVTVAEALDWEVTSALEHLRTCDDCRARLAVLTAAHLSYAETAPISENVVARITGALAEAARQEQTVARSAERAAQIVESLLVGATAAAVIVSAGVGLGEDPAALAMAFITGAGGALAWRRLAANRTALSH